jgi:hypothetical protein
MRSLQLHFNGPLTFTPGDRCLFHSPLRDVACVYLWTIRSDRDHRHYIHYVGEAGSFARRQKEHLVNILGLNYGIFDPVKARQGIQRLVWPGLWRDKSADGPARLLGQYGQITAAVVEYISAMDVFVAETDVEVGLRRHIEGSIGWNLRNSHKDSKMLYPDDNHVGRNFTSASIRLEISSDEPIAGLDPEIEI